MIYLLSQRQKGTVRPEILIITIVIAVVAVFVIAGLGLVSLIVIPRVINAGHKAKDSALIANLQQLRGAVEIFHAESKQYYPKTLQVLTQTTFTREDLVDANGSPAPASFPVKILSGPYLKVDGTSSGLPGNPYADSSQNIADQWSYTNSTGTVKPGLATKVRYPSTTLTDGRKIADL